MSIVHRFALDLSIWLFTASTAIAADASTPVKIEIDPATTISSISTDFIGFGYKSSAVAQTNYFNGCNQKLIQLYRNLSDHGLIRIGGCASDNTWQSIPI